MSVLRQNLQQVFGRYISHTFSHIDTVRRFCGRISKWTLGKKIELIMLMHFKEWADQIDLNISHVTKSENKGEAFLEYLKSKVNTNSRRVELQEALAGVLKGTLEGLEELENFLDAVEKLAVTSLHVFKDDNQVLNLPKEINLELIQVVITAARKVCPLLLTFKRDAKTFFLPKLQNVEVLSYQLDRYIQTTQKICEKFGKSSISELYPKMGMKNVVSLNVDWSEDDIKRIIYHISQLDEIRMNQNFRMVFLFQEASCSDFIREFSEHQPRMNQFLKDLEETAVQLDRMNKGAKISSVAGSSVGAVGGVLSIVGLALMPFTAGASLGLVIGGTALGITSGVNSAVTIATEIGVNRKYQKKASEVFQSFMEDVQSLQNCLDEVISQTVTRIEEDHVEVAVGVGKVLGKAGVVGKGIDSLVDAASAVKLLKSEEMIAGVGKVVAQEGKALRNMPRVASDIPDIGQAAVKGPLALSKSSRASLIGVNALFLGMDIFFIFKDGISLAKGSETEVSQLIRARAALWSSEMKSWKKIHDSLCEGQQTYEKHQTVLDRPFYPERSQDTEKEKKGFNLLEQMNKKRKEKRPCIIM